MHLSYKENYLDKCKNWINSFYKHGCKFILNGHANVYVRTNPLLPVETVDKKNGIVTIVNGTGRASWKESIEKSNRIGFTPTEKSFPTITFLIFEGNKAHLETVDCCPGKNLEVIDSCDYQK